MILIDSSVWIAYFNGIINPETDRLDSLLGIAPVGTGDIMLTEVLQGFRHDSDFAIAKDLLSSIPIYNMLNTELAYKSADNYRWLRKQGLTIRKIIDVIIATFCIENDFALLHCDKDFLPFHQILGLRNAMEGL
jgi:predicted nucleic acid-binding protein